MSDFDTEPAVETMAPGYDDLVLSIAPDPRVGSPGEATLSSASGDAAPRSVAVRLFASEAAMFEARADGGPEPISVSLDLASQTMLYRQITTQDPGSQGLSPYYGELFEPSALLPFWQSLGTQLAPRITGTTEGSLGSPPRARRLKIAATGWINDLPWEMLCDAAGKFLALSPSVRIARTIPRMVPVAPLPARLPLRVLVVAPNPRTELQIDTDTELAALRAYLDSESRAYNMLSLAGPDATRERLQNTLRSFQPHILHYVGHAGLATGQGCLIFARADGAPDWLSAPDLSRMLPISTRLICLATCCTVTNYNLAGLARLACTPGDIELPTVVANQTPVTLSTVNAFWPEFYRDFVASEGDVTGAVRAGRLAVVQDSGEAALQWASFRLVVRDQTGNSLAIPPRPRTSATRIEKVRQEQEIREHYTTQVANRLAQRMAAIDIVGGAAAGATGLATGAGAEGSAATDETRGVSERAANAAAESMRQEVERVVDYGKQ